MAQTLTLGTEACNARVIGDFCGDNYIELTVTFYNSAGAPAALDTTPTLDVVHMETEIVKVTSQAMTAGGPVGEYKTTLNLNSWDEGDYRFTVSGALATVPVQVRGAFQVQAPTIELQLVEIIKSRLGDLKPALYKLDLPVPKWDAQTILRELRMALIWVSTTGVAQTPQFATFVRHPRLDLILDRAFYHSLTPQALIENWNTYSMSDGSATVNFSRAQPIFALIDQGLRRGDQDVRDWKKTVRPGVYGHATNFFPVQIRRAIAFLPNMSQVFGP